MIKCEYYSTRNDGIILVKTYSDSNKYIKQIETNVEYSTAIDIGKVVAGKYYPQLYTYVETDKEIKESEE